jgi:GDP-L-fucose synthase
MGDFKPILLKDLTNLKGINMSTYKGKKILVTGGTGLIGRPVVEMLLEQGANVRVVSLDNPPKPIDGTEFIRGDLRNFDTCLEICNGMDYVFNVAGIKGSPAMSTQRPASFFVNMLRMNINMMEAARQNSVERYLYTSSIGVYAPAEVFHEDDVWKTFPSNNDRFAGWSKRMGELQAEAYQIEYGWESIAVVRPANVYGPWDNFDPNNAMVIPSLVRRVVDGENPLVVWGDGSQIRDFVHAKDVASGILMALDKGMGQVINLGSGSRTTIREIVDVIANNFPDTLSIEWDTSKPSGDAIRLMDVSRAKAIGWQPEISIQDGVRSVIEWYSENGDLSDTRYNAFTEKAFLPS